MTKVFLGDTLVGHIHKVCSPTEQGFHYEALAGALFSTLEECKADLENGVAFLDLHYKD